MNATSAMYTKLFNELTHILDELEKLKERIKNMQLETEELYMRQEI